MGAFNPVLSPPKPSASMDINDIVSQAVNAQVGGPAAGVSGYVPAADPTTGLIAPPTVADFTESPANGKASFSQGLAALYGGEAPASLNTEKFQTAADQYLAARRAEILKRLQQVAPDTAAGRMRNVDQQIQAAKADPKFAALTPDQQMAQIDARYTKFEQSLPVASTADAGPSNATSLGYTPQDIAALQAVAAQYLTPYAQQAQASGGIAQASLQSLASQAATPQMRVYATQAANAQKAAQDQLAAAYMAQVSAAPTMAVIQANTQLAQQLMQANQQNLMYQARSQQPSSTTGMDPAAMTAAVQVPG